MYGFRGIITSTKVLYSKCCVCQLAANIKYFSSKLEVKYSEQEKSKILRVINEADLDVLSRYDLTKGRVKTLSKWKSSNGHLKSLSDIELIDGFSENSTIKLCDSIINDSTSQNQGDKVISKLKGQILYPALTAARLKDSNHILAVYTSVNSICWSGIDMRNYELTNWDYHSIDYQETKKFHLTDIMQIAWSIVQKLPDADLFVMKSEPTSLRAAGGDPNNPKVLTINLQKAQLVAIMVALLNARRISYDWSCPDELTMSQCVYFLRSSLPFRLFGTLVGSERVSSDQIVEDLMPLYSERAKDNSHVYIPDELKTYYRSKSDLQKDMLGQCLFLALTFMDVCVYKNVNSIATLTK